MKILSLFLFFICLSFSYLKCNNEHIILTLQYPNSRRVSQVWNKNELEKFNLFKNIIDDVNFNSQVLLFPLHKDVSHITHQSLKNLIQGETTEDKLEQYIKDNNYFIGNNEIKLYDVPDYQTVNEKLFHTYRDFFLKNYNIGHFNNFVSLDLDEFLHRTFNIDFKTIDIKTFVDNTKIPYNYEQIINLIRPAISFKVYPTSHKFDILANRLIVIDSLALCNLIKLTIWKKDIGSNDHINNEEELSTYIKKSLDEFSKIKIELKLVNLIFDGINVDTILDNIDSIKFENCSMTISDNDINSLKRIQKFNITKAAPGILDFYGPYYLYYNGTAIYKKHSLEIDFINSKITNPDKLLALFDMYNGYFKTILIKHARVSLLKLKIKKFLCRKLVRIKFLLLCIINLFIIISLFKYNHPILGMLTVITSPCIQSTLYYRMIDYPENAASKCLNKSLNTTGGVTFEFE